MAKENTNLFVYNPGDGSWFAVDDSIVVRLSGDITDPDDIETHLQECGRKCVRIDQLIQRAARRPLRVPKYI